jgi:nucleoside 2-deoxyribosyltransferase
VAALAINIMASFPNGRFVASTISHTEFARKLIAPLASCSMFDRSEKNMRIYLAGPLFSIAERTFNDELARLLRDKGHEVWLPQEFEQRTMTPSQIFAKDVEGIDWADVVVANMDGPDPDSGTCWECGYAYRKKPVILFRTDYRAGYKLGGDLPDSEKQNDALYNLMLTQAATKRLDLPFASLESVAESIDHVLDNF